MRRRDIAAAMAVGVLGLSGVWFAGAAAANTPKPEITGLAASPSILNASGGQSTISASVLNATSCTISANPALVSGAGAVNCSGGTVSQGVTFAQNTSSRGRVKYKVTLTATGSGGTKNQRVNVEVLPAVVASLASTGYGSCSLLTSGRVDCWGNGTFGQLGNGIRYQTGHDGSAIPVQVVGVGGIGTLTGVASLNGDSSGSYCAILDSSGVDCWGLNYGTDTPVQMMGVGGSGILTGVTSLASDGYADDVCAVLAAGGVDCWGGNYYGELGNGTHSDSATPVQVEGVGGTGTLTGVTSLTSDATGSFCALLATGGVDCWGWGNDGELGNGTFYTATDRYGSDTPVQVEGVGGTGTLTGGASLATDGGGFCAVLDSGGVDCWGFGPGGGLGNGAQSDSATPVQVEGVGGTGTLTVASLFGGWSGYCALPDSGGVDCWGSNDDGELGNGTFSSSDTPVQVEGVGGSGTLTGVTSIASVELGFCAVLDSGGVDCWGTGEEGELGNGHFYRNANFGSATPVQVTRGHGILAGVASITAGFSTYCAVLDSGGADCWGLGVDGELGRGEFINSAHPVRVSLP